MELDSHPYRDRSLMSHFPQVRQSRRGGKAQVPLRRVRVQAHTHRVCSRAHFYLGYFFRPDRSDVAGLSRYAVRGWPVASLLLVTHVAPGLCICVRLCGAWPCACGSCSWPSGGPTVIVDVRVCVRELCTLTARVVTFFLCIICDYL